MFGGQTVRHTCISHPSKYQQPKIIQNIYIKHNSWRIQIPIYLPERLPILTTGNPSQTGCKNNTCSANIFLTHGGLRSCANSRRVYYSDTKECNVCGKYLYRQSGRDLLIWSNMYQDSHIGG
ncbi:hypothetical protein GDO81_013172 [Engystomops pustulosus]|uniref:Uncharacterized protein n=1 Tax=Engystomops pustulosus TaxID=76066 RepID=A0AAV7B2P9_ENGPU|nr:hypothetical protein GDO81_013172 [Engystomops pustulosus]